MDLSLSLEKYLDDLSSNSPTPGGEMQLLYAEHSPLV